MSTYTTANGDTWDSIAYNEYGDVKCAEQLMAANESKSLLATIIFDAGTVLKLPEIDTSDAADTDDDSQPPWRTT